MADIPPPISTRTSASPSFELKTALNSCRATASYTKISDLREESGYRIVKFERVSTPYGETVMAVLEGLVGDDYYLRVYLPRRFNETLTDRMIDHYNTGLGDRLHLVRRCAAAGSKYTPLEFV